MIWTLERLGLVKNVYRIPPALLQRRRLSRGSTPASKPNPVG
jgi:hypothetical protein